MWDVTTTGITAALDGLAARGQVRAHNLANAETPGFRAEQVRFEETLAEAWGRGRPERMAPTTGLAPTVVDGRGNSVDLETEIISVLGLLGVTSFAELDRSVLAGLAATSEPVGDPGFASPGPKP